MPQSFFCYLMGTCNCLLRSLSVLSCLLGPVIAVYGIEVSGLSIKQVNQCNVQEAKALAHSGSPVVSLDKLLGEYPFLAADDERVGILSGEDSSDQGSDSELTDTEVSMQIIKRPKMDGCTLQLIPQQMRSIQNGPTFCRKMRSTQTRLHSP